MPDRYCPGLAGALSNLGVSFLELGRPADALAPAEEAVALCRELAASSPDRCCAELAIRLSNHSQVLWALDRSAEAAVARDEADAICDSSR